MFYILRNEACMAQTPVAAVDHNNNFSRKPSESLYGDLKYHKTYSER